jgi:MFS family permease
MSSAAHPVLPPLPSARPQPPRRPLVALYVANLISRVGDAMLFLAIPWFVLQTTGSIARTGLAAFFSTAAVAVAALFGSGIVDHLGFRRASVISDLVSGVAVTLIPLCTLTVGLPFWALLVFVFLAGLLATPGTTARRALVPELASLGQVRLERVTALTDGINRLATFLGAPLAGVLIILIGTSNLLWFDGASFFASALLIGLLVPRTLAPAAPPAADEAGTSVMGAVASAPSAGPDGAAPVSVVRRSLANARDGIAFIARDPVLVETTMVVLVSNLLDAGFGAVLLPAYVKQVYGSAVVLGVLVAAFGGAAFVGALIFGAIGHVLPRGPTLGWSYTLGGATRYVWIILLAPILPVLVAVYALCGFTIGPVNPLFDTIDYERVPTAWRARVFGAMTAGSYLGIPLGGLLAGGLAPVIGLRACILAFGAVYLVVSGSLLVHPAVRSLRRAPTAPPG